jgi:hypothetical protein
MLTTEEQTWAQQNENKAEGRERESIYSQTNISQCEQRYAIAWKYIDLGSNAVRRFSKSEQLPEDGK